MWIIMPILGAREFTETAIADCLAQTIPTKILLINQGVDESFRNRLEKLSEEYPERIFVWSHNPPLPSLAATWNRALSFVWSLGEDQALVVNNDVRLHPQTCRMLCLILTQPVGFTRDPMRDPPLFVSAVGVTAEQFNPQIEYEEPPRFQEHGGPDFSCFLISRAGHWKYPFDESFVPAFTEDLDLHRRFMLGGDGARIFSINLPFLHYSSQTLKTMSPEARQAHEARITAGSRAHYQKKWGGPVNEEIYTIPFDATSAQEGVTTPDLQHAVQADHVSSD